MRFDRRARTGLLLGGVSQFLAICTAFLASLFGFAFAPAALGQAIIEVLPGWISVPLIELLQFWAQRLLVAGILGAFLAVGAAVGALTLDPRRSTRTVVLAGAAPWAGAAILAALFASAQIPLTASLVGAGIGLAAYFGTLAMLADGAQGSGLDGPPAVASPDRRRALLGVMAIGIVATVGALFAGQPLRAIGSQARLVKQTARRLTFMETVPAGDPAFDSVPNITPRLTDIKDHYTVDTALIDPRVDAARWKLEVKGAVEEPFAMSYDELLDLGAVEQLHTLECISNEVGGDLIGTTVWTGVPLRDLLARARPLPGAFDVVLRSADGYTDSIRLARAMEPKTLVAYLMDGYTLPEDHGYPARVLVPNIYGMKNVKWLTGIEVVTSDFLGYWMERGWSDLAVVNTHSRIDTPSRVRWDGGAVALGGIANAGSRTIARVEISTDRGARWTDAELEPALGPLTWRRWRYLWTPPGSGKHVVLIRATDGEGQLQTATRRPPFPSGSTGLDSVELDVTRG